MVAEERKTVGSLSLFLQLRGFDFVLRNAGR